MAIDSRRGEATAPREEAGMNNVEMMQEVVGTQSILEWPEVHGLCEEEELGGRSPRSW